MIGSLAAVALTACIPDPVAPGGDGARLLSRPGTPTIPGAAKGMQTIAILRSRVDIYVPQSVVAGVPAGLDVFLHNAGRRADAFVSQHLAAADASAVILVVPYSTGFTWDAIDGAFGPDPYTVDGALQWVFDRWDVAPARVGISGFADGATYALGLARANGDLFPQVAAYTPGFVMPVAAVPPRPSVLISHGTGDPQFPVAASGQVVADILGQLGYVVDYRELDIGHEIPQAVVEEFVTSLG